MSDVSRVSLWLPAATAGSAGLPRGAPRAAAAAAEDLALLPTAYA
jgi:hypothetical protein